MTIPVLNIYHLLVYAWGRLPEGDLVDVRVDDVHDVQELLANVLASGTEYVVRRGLDRRYEPRHDRLRGIRGRLDFNRSVATASEADLTLYCAFEELSHDTLANRILRTTLRQLSGSSGLNEDLIARLRGLYRRLDGISEVRIQPRHFSSVVVSRNNRFYRFLMNVCQLVHENLLPESPTGEVRFRDFVRDDRKMRLLFQAFVYNFAREKLKRPLRVSAPIVDWQGVSGDAADLALIPALHTDITITADTGAVIIDTKFSAEALEYPFGSMKLKSEHLYQLTAYLENYARVRCPASLSGVLLYPTVARHLDINVRLLDRPIRVVTLNLNQHWSLVERDLLSILQTSSSALSAGEFAA